MMMCVMCACKMNHLEKDLWACSACGIISSELPPDYTTYNADYYQNYVRMAGTDLGKAINAARWDLVTRHMPEGGGLLDYGCGAGHFAATNPNGKFRVAGYDLNPASGCSVQDVLKPMYDGVTFWDSIEHVKAPKTLVTFLGCPKWLFVTVPDVSHVGDGDIITWRHYKPGEHLHYFTLGSLAEMLRSLGYRIMEHNRTESVLRNADNPEWLISVAARRVR